MEKSLLIFFTFFILIGVSSNAQNKVKTKQRVLFLGNSYTYVNNLPIIIKYIATIEGDTLITDENLIGGYTLKGHSTNQISISKIMQGNWDAVVLQEQSQLPSFPIEDVEDDVFPAAKYLDSLIHVYNPCAKTIFYMTWGRKNGDKSNCQFWPPVCTYAGMDSLLNLRYKMMAAQNNAIVSPVGQIWKEVRETNPEIVLYQSDESHPDLAGSYAAACSFYTTLFKRNPLDISYNYEMDTSITNPIKRACKKHIYDSLEIWDYTLNPVAKMSYSLSGKTANFSNLSTNANSYFWDFGDGTSDTTINPSHTFEKNGVYKIKLKASKCDIISYDSIEIVVLASGLNKVDNNLSTVSIYPNPSENNINIQFNKELAKKLNLYSINGQKILEFDQENISKNLIVDNLKAGMYTLQFIWFDGTISYHKILVK